MEKVNCEQAVLLQSFFTKNYSIQSRERRVRGMDKPDKH
jgi:hypothetical protein